MTLSTDRWSTALSDENNIIGRGIIVHGGKDDYNTQPSGNSGPRIGCGVIEAYP
ncbi:Copper/zinc superoxide dismutase (SODC) [compost metagenome]